jgi:riboflavin synthase
MFTGIVEEAARVLSFIQGNLSWELEVRAANTAPKVAPGDSVSVNGVCLTVRSVAGRNMKFDVLEETRSRTTLADVEPGSEVNVERSLKVGSRMGGHFVTGHVDGQGVIEIWEQRGNDWFLQIRPPPEFLRYIVFKGSIAINGISLTVAGVDSQAFSVWIIPQTLEVTTLRLAKVGDYVNLECDMLAKYAEKILLSAKEATVASAQV